MYSEIREQINKKFAVCLLEIDADETNIPTETFRIAGVDGLRMKKAALDWISISYSEEVIFYALWFIVGTAYDTELNFKKILLRTETEKLTIDLGETEKEMCLDHVSGFLHGKSVIQFQIPNREIEILFKYYIFFVISRDFADDFYAIQEVKRRLKGQKFH